MTKTRNSGFADPRGSFLWGGTGTNAANFRGVGLGNSPVATNTFGAQFEFDVNSKLSVRGWGGYTDANIINDGAKTVVPRSGTMLLPLCFLM